jgi:hypothetical protein
MLSVSGAVYGVKSVKLFVSQHSVTDPHIQWAVILICAVANLSYFLTLTPQVRELREAGKKGRSRGDVPDDQRHQRRG